MKNLIFATLLLFTLSCTERQPTHQVRTNGQDSVVYVQVPDQNGNMQSFWMNYMMFSMLMNNGGYNNVNHYYHTHTTEFVNNENKYDTYAPVKNTYTPRYEEKAKPSSYSSPSRTSSPSSPSRSTYTPSTKSTNYSSPSRSTYTPSKSYSSPSRTYSSPSRSTPSRSSSSPSRK